MQKCPECGGRVTRGAKGRPRKFCSESCRSASKNARKVTGYLNEDTAVMLDIISAANPDKSKSDIIQEAVQQYAVSMMAKKLVGPKSVASASFTGGKFRKDMSRLEQWFRAIKARQNG